jgi:hypothetical protein
MDNKEEDTMSTPLPPPLETEVITDNKALDNDKFVTTNNLETVVPTQNRNIIEIYIAGQLLNNKYIFVFLWTIYFIACLINPPLFNNTIGIIFVSLIVYTMLFQDDYY